LMPARCITSGAIVIVCPSVFGVEVSSAGISRGAGTGLPAPSDRERSSIQPATATAIIKTKPATAAITVRLMRRLDEEISVFFISVSSFICLLGLAKQSRVQYRLVRGMSAEANQ